MFYASGLFIDFTAYISKKWHSLKSLLTLQSIASIRSLQDRLIHPTASSQSIHTTSSHQFCQSMKLCNTLWWCFQCWWRTKDAFFLVKRGIMLCLATNLRFEQVQHLWIYCVEMQPSLLKVDMIYSSRLLNKPKIRQKPEIDWIFTMWNSMYKSLDLN